MSEPRLLKSNDESRYELRLAGTRIGLLDFTREGHVVDLRHTEVDPAHGGKGYAAKLVRFALEDIRDAGLLVIPTCPYVAKYIERNPEFAGIVSIDEPGGV